MVQAGRLSSGTVGRVLLAVALASGVGVLAVPPAPAVANGAEGAAVAAGDRGLPQRATRQRLVFARFVTMGLDEIRNELFSSRPDGSGVRRLTFGHENDGPRWSPQGGRILFFRDSQVWVMGASGQHKHRILGGFNLGGGDWAPGGQRIVIGRGVDRVTLVVHSLRSGMSHRLTGDFAFPGNPRWSPNGRRILFQASTSSASEVLDLFTIKPNGTGLRNLTSTRTVHEGSPDWSPDGKRIVYARQGNKGCQALHVVRADGSRDRRIPQTCNGDQPIWFPDGRRILFSPLSNSFSFSRLVVVSLRGTHKRAVTEGHFPDWRR